jgi:hypothetical protein
MEATIALQDLPPDMLGVILGFCEIYDLPNVARVCNNWRRVTMIPWVVDSMMQETAQASKSSSGLGYPFIDSSLFFFLLLPYSLLSSSWPFDSPLLRGQKHFSLISPLVCLFLVLTECDWIYYVRSALLVRTEWQKEYDCGHRTNFCKYALTRSVRYSCF